MPILYIFSVITDSIEQLYAVVGTTSQQYPRVQSGNADGRLFLVVLPAAWLAPDVTPRRCHIHRGEKRLRHHSPTVGMRRYVPRGPRLHHTDLQLVLLLQPNSFHQQLSL